MSEQLLRADVLVMLGYLAATLGVAAYVARKSRDVEGYSLGNRSIPSWALGLSVLGTFTSGITFLSLPAKTFAGDWNVFVFGLALPLAAVVATVWFVPLYRRQVQLSAFELLEARFGYWARLYADVSYVVLQLIRVATVLLLVALAVSPMMQWEIIPTLIALGAIVIVYDTVGGFQAVVWTDVLQVGVLFLGAVWALGTVVAANSAGPVELLSSVPPEKFSLGTWASWDLGQSTVLVVLLYGITENLRNYGADQNYVQRMLAADSDASARRSIWIGALGYLPVSAIVCLIGTALFMHYGGRAPAGLKPDQVFPHFIQTELPAVVRGLVIAGILAAAMSTIDSCLNSMSTLLLADVLRRFQLKPRWIPEIVLLRTSTVLLGTLGTATAVTLYWISQEEARTIMDIWWQYAGTAGGGLFGLFLLAWLAPRLPGWAAAVGVLLTVPVLAWGTFGSKLPPESPWHCPLHGNLVGISATAVMLLWGGIVLLGVRTNNVSPTLPH